MIAIVAPFNSAVAPINSSVPLNNLYAIIFVLESRIPQFTGVIGKSDESNRLISISTVVKLDAP